VTDRWYSRPVLFVSDLEPSLAFYIGKLGFIEAWRHMDEDGRGGVAQVDRAGTELILTSHWPGKAGSALIFVSLDPDVLAAARIEFEGRGVEVKDGRWGYELMIVEDPDGNQLYFPYPQDEQE
jgi:catechol 2,3-dioxygenase-like lactoylglutathione lyase family enzyme